MPELVINKVMFYSPVDFVMKKRGETWKIPALWCLRKKNRRYRELQRDLEHISQKMLVQRLKQRETDGRSLKSIYTAVPDYSQYYFTAKSQQAVEVISYLIDNDQIILEQAKQRQS